MGLDAYVEWIAVVPVKAGTEAKTRLAHHRDRAVLAEAMAQDTIAALRQAPSITDVVIVVDGHVPGAWRDMAIRGPGAGLNAAISAAARWIAERSTNYALAIVTADLPCLTAEVVENMLAREQDASVRIVGDAAGTGTTMLLVKDGRSVPERVMPQFGPHSCAAHVAAGAINLTTRAGGTRQDQQALVRARRDVDTDVDLWDAIRIGVGPATRAALMET